MLDRGRLPRRALPLRPAVPRLVHHRAGRAAAGRRGPRVLRRDLAADGPAQERLARHPRLRRVAGDGALRARLRALGAAAHAGAARAEDGRARGRRDDAVASAKTGPRLPAHAAGQPTRSSRIAYRFAILGFIFWTFTLIAGSIWANDAWGRYWGFDTKEVWTFVIWVLYAGYIHARATRGWRGSRSAWLSIIGFTAVHVQLHDREHVLQGPARLLRPELTRSSSRCPRWSGGLDVAGGPGLACVADERVDLGVAQSKPVRGSRSRG